jgi:hypothetical protein
MGRNLEVQSGLSRRLEITEAPLSLTSFKPSLKLVFVAVEVAVGCRNQSH